MILMEKGKRIKFTHRLIGLIFLLAFSFFFISPLPTKGQKNTAKEDTSCETGLLKFDEALFGLQGFSESFLIIIVHKGKGERKAVIKSRLDGLKKLAKIRKVSDKLIFAEGDTSKTNGRADIYLNGKIYRQIYYERKAKGICSEP